MGTCQTCAKHYDPKVTTSPSRYCSNECYDIGARPYNKASLDQYYQEDDNQDCVEPFKQLDLVRFTAMVQSFATKAADKIHYLQHDDIDRLHCRVGFCAEAKLLGL